MKGRKGQSRGRKSGPEFTVLREFFAGYLHQDFRDEYGSAVEAAAAFCKDAQPADIAALRNEWDVWRNQLGNVSLAKVAAAIHRLGGAWQPQTLGDLDGVSAALKSGSNPDC